MRLFLFILLVIRDNLLLNAMYLLIHVQLLLVGITLTHQTILTFISFVTVILSLTFFLLVFTIIFIMLEVLGWVIMIAMACLRNNLLLLLLLIVVLLHVRILLLAIILFLFIIGSILNFTRLGFLEIFTVRIIN